MESELLFIGLQKWNQSFCLLVYRNGTKAFVYWFTEMGSKHLFIGLQKWDQSSGPISVNQ
jgi:hypothetical protein